MYVTAHGSAEGTSRYRQLVALRQACARNRGVCRGGDSAIWSRSWRNSWRPWSSGRKSLAGGLITRTGHAQPQNASRRLLAPCENMDGCVAQVCEISVSYRNCVYTCLCGSALSVAPKDPRRPNSGESLQGPGGASRWDSRPRTGHCGLDSPRPPPQRPGLLHLVTIPQHIVYRLTAAGPLISDQPCGCHVSGVTPVCGAASKPHACCPQLCHEPHTRHR